MRLGSVMAVCLLFAGLCGCAHERGALDRELSSVVAGIGPVEVEEEDELRAYSPELYLTGLAGRGVGDDLDLSASCGCAESGSSGPMTSSGPGSGPGIEHKLSKLRVIIHLIKKH